MIDYLAAPTSPHPPRHTHLATPTSPHSPGRAHLAVASSHTMWTIQIIDSYLTQAVNRLPRHTHLGEPTSPPPRRAPHRHPHRQAPPRRNPRGRHQLPPTILYDFISIIWILIRRENEREPPQSRKPLLRRSEARRAELLEREREREGGREAAGRLGKGNGVKCACT